MRKKTYRFGFTLIELMLSIALGSLIVYIAIAAFRVASQTMTLAHRLALENTLIRAGMCEAHNQLDFWTNLDNPDDATNQRLRVAGVDVAGSKLGLMLGGAGLPTTAGLAFTRMSNIFPPNKLPRSPASPSPDSQVPRFANSTSPQVLTTAQLEGNATWESDTGFDPTCVWAPHDPRTWYRGNCIEKINPIDNRFGRYSIFTNTDANPVFCAFPSSNGDPTSTYSAKPLHRWYAQQLFGFGRALGFYGLCEYVPSNVLFSTYTSYVNGKTSRGGIPRYFACNERFLVGEGMINIPTLGLNGLTHTQSYCVSNPVDRTVNDLGLTNEIYRYYASDYSSQGTNEVEQFVNITIRRSSLMSLQPSHWSVVSVGVGHFVKSARFFLYCQSSLAKPIDWLAV